MQLIVTPVYELNELSHEAKNKAYIDFYNSEQYDFEFYDIQQTLYAFCDIFDIDIKEFDFTNSISVYYNIRIGHDILEMKGKRLISYLWNNYKNNLFKGKYLKSKSFEAIPQTKHKYQYFKEAKRNEKVCYWCTYRSNINLENEAVLTGCYYDESILKPIYKILKEYDPNTQFFELIDNCLYNFAKEMQQDYEYFYSIENFEHISELNEYRYNEHGKLI
jgi:hypothetical protein